MYIYDFYINYIYTHYFWFAMRRLGVINSKAWKRGPGSLLTYKDVVGKYYKLSSTDMQDDIAMSHKSGLVKFWFYCTC